MRVMMQAKLQAMMMLVFAVLRHFFFFSSFFFTFKASGYGRFKQ